MIQTVKTNGFETDYFRFGKEGAQPLAVIPGLSLISVMTFADMVAKAYDCYAKDRDVILLDRRKQLPEEYSLTDMAEDTAAVLDKLGIKNADIIGVSQGGIIALLLALSRPDLVRSLALCSTAASLSESSEGAVKAWVSSAKAGDKESLVRSFGEYVYTPSFFEANKAGILGMARIVGEEELERFAVLAGALTEVDLRSRLGEIKAPACVFAGAEDRIFTRESFTELSEGLRCELKIFEDFGHAVYDEMAGFHDAVNGFFHSI